MGIQKAFFLGILIKFAFTTLVFAEIADSNEAQQAQPPSDNRGSTDQCAPLKPGDTLVMDQNPAQSPTMVERKYELKRDKANPNRYVALLNIDLIADSLWRDERQQKKGDQLLSPSDIERTNIHHARKAKERNHYDETVASMYARVQECFRESKGKVQTPSGKFLDFELKVNSNVPKVPVFITQSGERSNSREWSGDLKCGTIIHEALHLMGLCDGYEERKTVKERQSEILGIDFSNPQAAKSIYTNERQFDCRSLAPESNIMHRSSITESEIMEIKICMDLDAVMKTSSNKMVENCPQNKIITSYNEKETLEALIRLSPMNAKNIVSLKKAPPEKQFTSLSEAQMRFITIPNCDSKNNLYITCSQNAYRTSVTDGCMDVPPECKNGEYLK